MNIAVFFTHKDKLKVLNWKWTSNVVPIFHSDYGKVGYKGIPLALGRKTTHKGNKKSLIYN